MIENSLREDAKPVIIEHGISASLLLGILPVNLLFDKKNGHEAIVRV